MLRKLKRRIVAIVPAGSAPRRVWRYAAHPYRRHLRRRIQAAVDEWSNAHPDAFVLQIGSHDGVAGDPLSRHLDRRPLWRAVLVEPVPQHFAALSELRGDDDRFVLVNAAVTDHDGVATMTTVAPTGDMPSWVDQLSSLDERQVTKHSATIRALAGQLRREQVRAMTLETLLAEVGVERLDLIHIDTEGHDEVILAQVDLGRWRPKLILYEHAHLADGARSRCEERLTAAGYRLRRSDMDTLALR